MPPLFRFIRELDSSRVEWAVMVRVVRAYKLHVRDEPSNVYAMEVVLHDSEGVRIHASIKRALVSRFATMFREEHLYAVKNFVVTENDNRQRTTNGQYKQIFIPKTVVTEVFDPQFPRNIYDFRMLDTFTNPDNINEDVLVDVIGRLVSRSNLQVREVQGRETSMLDIAIANLQGFVLPCTIWGEFAEMLHNHIEGRGEAIVIIMQLCKIRRFKGEVRLSNAYHVSKVIFNDDVIEIADFRRSLALEGRVASPIRNIPIPFSGSIEAELEASRDNIITLDQLICASEVGEFWVYCRIVDVEPMHEWYYISCKRCLKKVTVAGSTLYCDGCDVDPVGSTRYRVQVRVADSKGMASFILWDKDCVNLTRKSAAQLRATTYGKAIPDELMKFVGLEALFKVKVSEYAPGVNLGPFPVIKMVTNTSLIQRFGNYELRVDEFGKGKDAVGAGETWKGKRISVNGEVCGKGKGLLEEVGAPMKTSNVKFVPTTVSLGVKRCLMDDFGETGKSEKPSKFPKKDEE